MKAALYKKYDPPEVITIGNMAKPVSKDREVLIRIKDLVEKDILKPVIDRRFTLDQIAEAHSYVDMGHKKGNVMLPSNKYLKN